MTNSSTEDKRQYQFIQDMLAAILLIQEYTADIDALTLSNTTMLQDAIVRRFEILGEASARLSESFKAKYPHIPWQLIKSMRNLLIHEYDSIDSDILWNTIQEDIPHLHAQLEKILSKK